MLADFLACLLAYYIQIGLPPHDISRNTIVHSEKTCTIVRDSVGQARQNTLIPKNAAFEAGQFSAILDIGVGFGFGNQESGLGFWCLILD